MEQEGLLTGLCCDFCNIKEQKDAHFKYCSGCKLVMYCSNVCQNNHWKKHKSFCKKKQQNLVQQLEVKDVKLCECMTDVAIAYSKREGGNICSFPRCNKNIKPPYTFEMYMEECRNKKNVMPMHMIQIHYCSVKCRRKSIELEKNKKLGGVPL